MRVVGRPRLFEEQAALEEAMQLFWRQGYEGTSMSQLREAMGLSSASLYHAFGSKERLFGRVIEHYVSRPGSVVSTISASHAVPAGEALTQLLHRSIDEQFDDSHPRGCLVALAATVGPQDRGTEPGRIVADQRARDYDAIAALTKRAFDEGVPAAAVTSDALARLIHGFILALATQTHDESPAEDLHAAADALSTLWR
ncbi:TetR/AcrR family transcriptional regulator [Citricoccus sp.]|uniref:TetR/AcrR family transcriptional regulator n=1 Tax=Citricoccus sp. TaxID=1978372 RepID=UPI0028BDB730|nr:TetR/AcrR family transcriptional regulator [Citricoccus sp.]